MGFAKALTEAVASRASGLKEASEGPLGTHRVEKILKMAAKQVKNPMAKDWLLKDEEQTWRKEILKWFEKARKSPKFAKVSDEQVDKEIATTIAYMALSAVRRSLLKKEDLDELFAEAAGELTERKGAGSIIDQLRKIVSEKQTAKVNGKTVDLYTASAVTTLYDSLSDANKAKYEKMPLDTMIGICWDILEKQD